MATDRMERYEALITERDALRVEGLQHKKDIITLIKERDQFKAEVEELEEEANIANLTRDLATKRADKAEAHNARLRGALEPFARPAQWIDDDVRQTSILDRFNFLARDFRRAAKALADSAPGGDNSD